MRLDDRVCSGWFAVEHGLHQECVLSSILFAAVLSVAYTHLKADKGWCILKTKRRGGKTTPGESALTTSLWGMLYADDVGVVSQSPEQPRKMMGVIVVVCAAFGLTVSEAKTDIMCLRTKGMPEATTVFSVEAAGQVYNQTNVFLYLWGDVNHNADLSIEVDRRIRNAWCSFREHTLELYVRPSAPLELKIRMLRAEVLETMLYGCVTWSPRACLYDTLHRAHHSFLTRCIGWRKNKRTDNPISYLDMLMKTRSESIEAIMRRWILFPGFVARMEDTKLPKCVMSGELVGRGGLRGGTGKRLDVRCLLDGRPESFQYQRRPADDCSSGRGGMAQDGGTRGGTFHGEMERCRESQD